MIRDTPQIQYWCTTRTVTQLRPSLSSRQQELSLATCVSFRQHTFSQLFYLGLQIGKTTFLSCHRHGRNSVYKIVVMIYFLRNGWRWVGNQPSASSDHQRYPVGEAARRQRGGRTSGPVGQRIRWKGSSRSSIISLILIQYKVTDNPL
jgi:hypothetical protein